MNEIGKIQSFLETVGYEQKRCKCFGIETGQNPFITISRETGAGGHSVSAAILKEMEEEKSPFFQGWQVCDQELCKRITEEPDLRVSMQKLLASEYHSQIEDMIEEMIAGDSPQDTVVKRMFKIIRTLATFGKVIVIGRAGGCVTRDLPLGIHIRLIASLPSRIKRIMLRHNMDEKHAKQFILEQDKSRKNLVKKFFNRDIADPLLYDMVFNTDKMLVEDIGHSIVSMMTKKQPVCH